MSWISTHRRFFRFAVLLLFILAFIGPWGFELLSVPSTFSCSWPTIRVREDFCGDPMSGFEMLGWFGGGFFNILGEWLRGNLAGQGRQFLGILYVLTILLPIVGTIFSVLKKHVRAWQAADIVLWGVACVPAIQYWFILAQSGSQVFYVWGYWFYSAILVGAIILELRSRTLLHGDHPPQ